MKTGKPEAADVEHAISKLRGRDVVGRLGELAGTAGGAAAGASAAGAAAGAFGATTILGSSAAASLFGGMIVVTTPVGWVIGCAAAGGVAAYGITRLIRSGARQDEVRSRLIARLKGRVTVRSNAVTAGGCLAMVERAVEEGALAAAQAERIKILVSTGRLDPGVAADRVTRILATSE